jgi:cysteine desulfurase
MRRIYLDHSATTPLDPQVLDAMMPYLSGIHGNPSSIHLFGREARQALETARASVAGAIGAAAEEVVFTSGGTEADNTALWGVVQALRPHGRDHIVTSQVEHHAVLESAHALAAHGARVDEMPVEASGRLNPGVVRASIRSTTALVSVMHANNEIGTVQPVKEIAEIAHEAGALMHTDAVQSLGKIPFHVDELGVDLASFSAHKIYGPKGIGALYIRKGVRLEPLLRGGSQEVNRRGGTEAVALAVGFAKALEICRNRMEADGARQIELREELRARIAQAFPHALFNGVGTPLLPNILSVSFDSREDQVDGDALVMGLDLRGVAVTSGSACSSGTLEASHVLLALGRDRQTARATVRFSLGRSTTAEDIVFAVQALTEVAAVARERSAHP